MTDGQLCLAVMKEIEFPNKRQYFFLDPTYDTFPSWYFSPQELTYFVIGIFGNSPSPARGNEVSPALEGFSRGIGR